MYHRRRRTMAQYSLKLRETPSSRSSSNITTRSFRDNDQNYIDWRRYPLTGPQKIQGILAGNIAAICGSLPAANQKPWEPSNSIGDGPRAPLTAASSTPYGCFVRLAAGAPSTLPDLPEHAENHAGMAQRFLRAAIKKNRGQNQKSDRSLASEPWI